MTDNAYARLSKDIIERHEFKIDYRLLFERYIWWLIGEAHEEPDQEIASRLVKSAQVLVASGVSEYIEMGVKIIDMFLEIEPSYWEELLIIAEASFSILGNFPNIKLIDERWKKRKRLSRSLDRILTEEMHRSINTIEALDIEATDFQVDLWNSLQKKTDLVTIAPTSAGKSYIILNYIVQAVVEAREDQTYAVYIVPTRALIYEITKKIQDRLLRKGIHDVDVVTVAQRGKTYERKTVFVMTQERMLMLLHFQPLMRFAHIVVDEAQNIAEGNRGVLLHIVLSDVVERGPVQLIFSTPSKNYRNTFDLLLENSDTQRCTTERSPVSKNEIFVSCSRKELVLTTQNPEIEIRIPKGFTEKDYYKIVKRLGGNSRNIVFCSTKTRCEKMVKKLEQVSDPKGTKAELEDAADYVRKTVHEKYSLADAITKGIVFHYGPLPRNIRIMIENCVEEKLIDYVVCTTTLAEGVNMPVQNLFIRDPKIVQKGEPSRALSPVQMKNIVGRAGRLLKNFSGNVFYVDHEEWEFPDSIKEEPEAPKLPTYFKLLKEKTAEIVDALHGKKDDTTVNIHTLNATINKLLRDREKGKLSEVVKRYVDVKDHKRVISAVNSLVKRIEIPAGIRNLNPTIGVVQQDELYKFLKRQHDLSSWAPRLPHEARFRQYLSDLVDLFIRFDFMQIKLYGTEEEAQEIRRRYCYRLSLTAENWVKEVPLRKMIQDYIDWCEARGLAVPEPDEVVKDTVEMIDGTVRFTFANAAKCFCQIYTQVTTERGEDENQIPEFYSFLEIGASSDLTIRLISAGLSRQTAIEVSRLVPKIDAESENLIGRVVNHPNYSGLHRITRKEVDALR